MMILSKPYIFFKVLIGVVITMLATSVLLTFLILAFQIQENSPIQTSITGFFEELVRAIILFSLLKNYLCKETKNWIIVILTAVVFTLLENYSAAVYVYNINTSGSNYVILLNWTMLVLSHFVLHIILFSCSLQAIVKRKWVNLFAIASLHSAYNYIISHFPYSLSDLDSIQSTLLVKLALLVTIYSMLFFPDFLKRIKKYF